MDVDEEVQVTMVRKDMSSLIVCRRRGCIVYCLHVDEVGRMARSSGHRAFLVESTDLSLSNLLWFGLGFMR